MVGQIRGPPLFARARNPLTPRVIQLGEYRLYLQIEFFSLSRCIPVGLGWTLRPYVESVPRESLECSIKKKPYERQVGLESNSGRSRTSAQRTDSLMI